MKILHVASDLASLSGGPPVSILSNAQFLAESGHTVTVVAIDKHGQTIQQSLKDVDVRLFKPSGPKYFGVSVQMASFLIQNIRQFDLVIIHSLYLGHTAVASWLASKYSIPYIIQPHGGLDPYIYRRHRFRKYIAEWLFQNRALKRATAIWYTTYSEKELASCYANNPSYLISPPLVDYTPYFTVRSLCVDERLALVRKDPIIIFIGRVNFKKGLELLFKSYAEIRNDGIRARLIIAGPIDDEMRPVLSRLESKLSLVGAVEYRGLVGPLEKLDLLRSAAVFVLPSHSENFGIAVVEAIAAGVPVIISNKVNIHSAISRHNCGSVVDTDVSSLTKAIKAILSDDMTWKAQSEACADALRDCFSREVNGKSLLSEISRLVDKSR